MTDLDDQILKLKKVIEGNRSAASGWGVPTHLDIIGLEKFLESAVGGNRRAEANQVLQSLIKLEDLERQNIHVLKTYQFTSEQFGEFQIEAISVEEAQIKFNEWEREQELLQPISDPSIESAYVKPEKPDRVSVFVEPPPEEVTVAPPEYVKPEKPDRVSVFVEPPPETITVAPPEYEKPEKPDRVDVHDPSTESAFDPFGGLLEGVFGEPTEVTTVDVELPIEPEPEVTTDQVEPPIEPELEVTTADIEPPIEPEVITADVEVEVEVDPTEERPVKWIPEPFFSFLNEVFRR